VKVLVIGPGRVGSALARALAAAGEEVLAVAGRGPLPPSLADADAVLVAVPDGALGEVARALAASGIVRADAAILHTAGALGPSALAGAPGHLGTFHPLQTFASREAAPPLAGVPFALAGDGRALALGRSLAGAVGAVPIEVPEEHRALYHAAAVMACGHVALLARAAALALSSAAGVDAGEALRFLGPILRETAHNLATVGLPAALTGPVARGDKETMDRHRQALAAEDPELAAVYEAIARLG
jgi:predicted short-subunit dehydrogenase-like oxidoreductase (DUF2520 family)